MSQVSIKTIPRKLFKIIKLYLNTQFEVRKKIANENTR